MIEKFTEKLEGTKMTVISGISILLSLVLPLLGVKLEVWYDPAWIAVIISGIPLLENAVKKLIYKKGISKISSALLISVAMFASVFIGDVFAAGEIAFIMAIGELLEDKTTERAKRGLTKLISLFPVKARVITDGEERTVPAESIKADDILRILPGETVPADGVIIKGSSSIDQSLLTGESLPIDKAEGDAVYCGTINRFGAIDIRATGVGEDSTLTKLIRLATEAENKKAPTERIADKWASILVPVALLLAVIAGLVRQDLITAVTILVVFCPCALVLATPTAIMAAVGQATKHGVIIKSGEALEKMGKVDTVAFDKTGTITYGRLKVSDCIVLSENIDENKLLSLCASAETGSEHPIAKAICAMAKERSLSLPDANGFETVPGKGIRALLDGKSVLCGNESFLNENGISTEEAIEALSSLRAKGKATVLVADDKLLGIIALSDEIKENSAEVISRLESMDVNTVLLTGDNKEAAEHFSTLSGIKTVHSSLMPENKSELVSKMTSDGKRVCMVGDGINDAIALKSADVGVAMGTMGSDIAVEAADIAIMGDDISKLPYLMRLSRATVKTIRFSITLSLLINLAAIVLSFFGLLNPATGALVHNAGSVFVISIAALLYDRKF